MKKNKMDVYIGFHNERLIVMYTTIHARSFFKQNFNIIALWQKCSLLYLLHISCKNFSIIYFYQKSHPTSNKMVVYTLCSLYQELNLFFNIHFFIPWIWCLLKQTLPVSGNTIICHQHCSSSSLLALPCSHKPFPLSLPD